MLAEKLEPNRTSRLSLLMDRASAIRLSEPGPSRDQIEAILKAAVTAADHGRIRPWRFVVIQGEGRKRLGDLMAQAERTTNPGASDEQLEKVRNKALRAPVVIALVCKADPTHKVRVFEQQLAVAAAGAHLMLAAKALGFGSNWKTGSAAYNPLVRAGLGFAVDDAIIGFFHVGSEAKLSPIRRGSIDSVVEYWEA